MIRAKTYLFLRLLTHLCIYLLLQQQRLVFFSLQSPLVDLDSTSRAFFFTLVDSFVI